MNESDSWWKAMTSPTPGEFCEAVQNDTILLDMKKKSNQIAIISFSFSIILTIVMVAVPTTSS